MTALRDFGCEISENDARSVNQSTEIEGMTTRPKLFSGRQVKEVKAPKRRWLREKRWNKELFASKTFNNLLKNLLR